MSKKYNFRKINFLDYDKNILELLNQLSIIGEVSRDNFNDFINKINNNDNIHIFVAENENKNKIIAHGTIIFENKLIHSNGKVAHIEDIVIDKDERKNGLGKELINYLINFSKENNCYKIILDCKEELYNFYSKCGFEKKGIQMAIYNSKL